MSLARIPETEDQARHDEDGQGDHAREAIHLLEQGGRHRLDRVEHAADAADLRRGPRGHDDAATGARRNQGAAEGHAVPVAERGVRRRGVGRLFNRRGFAGEHGLLQAQAAGRQQPQICRHAVARFEQDDVAGHERFRIALATTAVPQDARLRGQHLLDGRQRPLRPPFLHEADDRVDQHHGKDHACIDDMTQQRGHGRRADQHEDQQVAELPQEPGDGAGAGRLGQPVRPDALQPPGRLFRGQSFGTRVQRRQNRVCGAAVPRRVGVAPGFLS